MYLYLKERIKHAVRFRHKRGFGVHSPFMFNLILNVIRDKEKKYRYPEEAECKRGIRYRDRKFYRLVVRLVNFLQAKYVLYLGNGGREMSLYLKGLPAELESNIPARMREAGFICIGREAQTVLQGTAVDFIPVADGRKCVLITDIYKNGFNARLWLQWRAKATVSVDMMWYGILLFDRKLQRGRYNLIL